VSARHAFGRRRRPDARSRPPPWHHDRPRRDRRDWQEDSMGTSADPLPLGSRAADFSLRGIDGRRHSLADVAGRNGTLVMFVCNHCPYVKAVAERIARDVRELRAHGIGAIAINPNDAVNYPEDAFELMKPFADAHGFDFPYVHDETQDVARAYGAVCTPDFFGFDAQRTLRYHGRLDASRKEPVANAPRELYDAMVAIARGGEAPAAQNPSFGCSIKWKIPAE
jgi:peroxiredoxin